MGTAPSKAEGGAPHHRSASIKALEPELEPPSTERLDPGRDFLRLIREYFALRDNLDSISKNIKLGEVRLCQHWGKREKDDGTLHPAFQQRNGRGDDVVQDAQDLIVVASLSQSSLQAYFQRMKEDFVFLQVKVDCEFYVDPILDAQSIIDQARNEYAKIKPGPSYSWMYNISKGHIVCATVDDMHKVVKWISQQSMTNPVLQSKHNFEEPEPATRYRQLMVNVKVPIGKDSWHVCQVTVHHKALFAYSEEASYYRRHLKEYLSNVDGPSDMNERLEDLETIGGYSSAERLEDGFCHVVSMCNNPIRVARIANLLEHALPPKSDACLKLYQKLLALMTKFGDEVSSASVKTKIGDVLLEQGQYELALESYGEAIETLREEVGQHDETCLTAEVQIGILHDREGKYEKATEILRSALSKSDAALGSNHPLTARLHSCLGNVLRNSGDYTGALDQHELALQTRMAVLGKNHHETATSYDEIGVVMQENGDFDFALKYHRRALLLRRAFDKPLDIADSYENLGLLLFRQQKPEHSLPLLTRSLEIREAYYGECHPLTAKSLSCIGLIMFGTKHYAQAQEFFEKALDTRKEMLGDTHPDTAVSYSSLGSVLRLVGDIDGAIKFHERALELSQVTVGTHPQTALFCCNLGTVLAKTGRFDQAIQHYRRAAAIRGDILGAQHEETLKTYETIERLISAKSRMESSNE